MHSVPFQHVYAVTSPTAYTFLLFTDSEAIEINTCSSGLQSPVKAYHSNGDWNNACVSRAPRCLQSPEKYNFPLIFIWLHAAVAVYHLIRRLLIFRIRAINWSLIITDDSFVSRLYFSPTALRLLFSDGHHMKIAGWLAPRLWHVQEIQLNLLLPKLCVFGSHYDFYDLVISHVAKVFRRRNDVIKEIWFDAFRELDLFFSCSLLYELVLESELCVRARLPSSSVIHYIFTPISEADM